MATLAPEVVRFGAEVHAVFEDKMEKTAEIAAGGLAGGAHAERLARAWSMPGVLIGGLNIIVRGMKSSKAADEVAAAIKVAAAQAAGLACASSQDDR